MKAVHIDLSTGRYTVTAGEAAAIELDRNSGVKRVLVTAADGHSYELGPGELFPLSEIEYQVSKAEQDDDRCGRLLFWTREEALIRRP